MKKSTIIGEDVEMTPEVWSELAAGAAGAVGDERLKQWAEHVLPVPSRLLFKGYAHAVDSTAWTRLRPDYNTGNDPGDETDSPEGRHR